MTQVVADPDSPAFASAESVRAEWVIRVDGRVRNRPEGTDNKELPTGDIEIFANGIEVLSESSELPLPVFGEQDYPEETRLRYRFLDLRRERIHANIMKRGAIIDAIRARMKQAEFFEFQTPILTASSPEGSARLSGAVAGSPRQILRPATGTPAVQTTHHDVRL